jgi:predicted Rossmann fold nucleotide-binding protein DprA/Smf involved in DNA uptake
MQMKKLNAQLKTVSRSLVSLSKQVEKISKQAEKLQPATKPAARKGKRVVVKRARKATAARGMTVLDTVYDVIKRSKRGVTIAQMKQKTKLDARQLSNALYKLSNKGSIVAKSRGLYVKK